MRKKTACLILFALLFVSTLSVVRIPQVKAWNGTVHIYSDGSVDPPSAPIHQNVDVYTLTDNVITTDDGIIIEANSITFDGNGHTIQGGSSGNGIDLTGTIYVTIKNANLQGFSIGIFAPSSNYDTISGNTVVQNSVGIWLESSSDDNIIGNNIQQNGAYGIWLSSSSNNNIYHNNFANNAVQVYTTYDSINIWDAGYPAAGNYWSDYTGSDLYSGPFQNLTGSDGIGDTPYVLDQNNVDHYPLIAPLTHDVGITGVSESKNVVGRGYNASINVSMFNYGTSTETFNATIYANQTIIGQTYNIELTSRNSTIFSPTWNTTGFAYGNYTISAYAWPVPGETNTANNNFTGSAVTVTIPGDINGDFAVGLVDLGMLAKAYSSHGPNYHYQGETASPKWNPNADINGDGIVGLSDLGMLAKHYNQHYP